MNKTAVQISAYQPVPDRALFFVDNFLSTSALSRATSLVEASLRDSDPDVDTQSRNNFLRHLPYTTPPKRYTAALRRLLTPLLRKIKETKLFKPEWTAIFGPWINVSRSDAVRGENGMDLHVDDDSRGPVLTCVISLCSPDFDGAVCVSNHLSRTLERRLPLNRLSPKKPEHRYAWRPKHNQLYFFNGSHVVHGISPVASGHRYSIVIFYLTNQSKEEVYQLWTYNALKPFQCRACYKRFATEPQLRKHVQNSLYRNAQQSGKKAVSQHAVVYLTLTSPSGVTQSSPQP